MKNTRKDEKGSALIIVLAFLFLLTIVTIAFLSRSLLERQLSNASLNQNKIDLVGQGAAASIIADLQQEIVAGSTASGSTYYPVNAMSMIPATVGFTHATPPTVDGLEDLLKVSQTGQGFFQTDANHPNGTPSNRASAIDTTQASLNFRSVSRARWNKALLLAKASPSSPIDITPVTTFPNPDWIYVARDGSNPTAWNAQYESVPSISPTTIGTGAGQNPISQRYAYAIYDEGSTLDMNVAGSPVTGTSGSSVTYTSFQPYKNALAYADLTQLPYLSSTAQTVAGGASSTSLSAGQQQTFINALVGWRNYASSQAAGDFPGPYTFSAATPPSTLTPFDLNTFFNPNGYLSVLGNTTTPQSDNAFSSRQQLLQFLLQGLGQNSSFYNAFYGSQDATVAAFQNLLPYLGTFSRDINQPSYAPSTAKQSAAPTAVIASGGNDRGGTGADAIINPSFLSVKVTNTNWTRSDGSIPVAGEPLVKKRFALSRLAWLTYLGPIATDNGTYNTTTGIANLVTILKNYGYTDAFLLQGGPTNIYKYFGLSWVADSTTTRANGDGLMKWAYNHENPTFQSSLSSATATKIPIRTLGTGTYTVISQNRDPDFFEILKASVDLGSLGKAYLAPGASLLTPNGYQQTLDNSADLQILQMGANIIDQFQPSGYCARILFSDGLLFAGKIQEIRGVEDLPYIYRMREGKITVTDSSPPQANCPTTTPSTPGAPGKVAVLQEPEIWNPHSYNPSSSDTKPRPTSFRAVAISTDPNSASSTAVAITTELQCVMPYSQPPPGTSYIPSTAGPVWNENNTELDFNIPVGDLYFFREPTLLIKPNIPAGSNLQAGSSSLIKTSFPSGYIASNWPAYQIRGNGVGDNQQYIGFLAGTGPAAWSAVIPAGAIGPGNPASSSPGCVEATFAQLASAVNGVTYRLQYLDPTGNWVTYDEKYMPIVMSGVYNNGSFYSSDSRTFSDTAASPVNMAKQIISSEIGEVCFDPRTSRFGMKEIGPGGAGSGPVEFPVRKNVNTLGWASISSSGASFLRAIGQLALMSERPDQYAGFNFDQDTAGLFLPDCGPTALGWYPASVATTFINPGMFSQNNPAEVANPTNKKEVNLDPQTVGGTLNQYFADPDKVVRRAMGAYVPTDSAAPADPPPSTGQPWGLPMKLAMDYSAPTPVQNSTTNEYQGRPLMLNRPFCSTADIEYVFSGTPWKNLDITTPESASRALLDVFTTNDTDDQRNLVAGKINLNTRQSAVLAAVIAGAYKDEYDPTGATLPNSLPLSSAYADDIALALVNRTTSQNANSTNGLGPLTNISELVGKWISNSAIGTSINGSKSYAGFTDDPTNSTNTSSSMYDLTQAFIKAGGTSSDINARIQRFRAAPIRALANVGTTRVWNLMIDVIAQTGRFPASASTSAAPLAAFNVEGERRYWVHVAIDRYTGKILDEQMEEVKE